MRRMLKEALNRRAGGNASPPFALVAFVCTLCMGVNACAAESRIINIPPGDLATALESVARQADVELIFQPDALKGIHTNGVVGMMTAQQATGKLLEGTHLRVRTDPDNGAMMVGEAAEMSETSTGASASTLALTATEEVEIRARRATLREMRLEMAKLEGRFYAEYNRLNTNHWWDVLCHWEAQGNHLKAQVCKPRFVDQGFGITFSGVGTPSDADFTEGHYLSPSPLVNRARVLEKWADYERNMLDRINASPELRRLVHERQALQERYEEARKQKLKDRIVVLD